MLFYIVYGILFVDSDNTKIKARSALNAMFVETVNTLVFVALTQHLIQSTIRCDNSTLLSPLPGGKAICYSTIFEKPSIFGV